MRRILTLLAAVVVGLPFTSVAAQPAPRVAATLDPGELRALETIRRNVWVAWFSGDTVALRGVLSPELVAISIGEPQRHSRAQTIAASARFAAEGGRFVSVAFDATEHHRFGDTVVMFAHFQVVTSAQGKVTTQAGRVTEVFVRVNGRWVHTSWHLDVR